MIAVNKAEGRSEWRRGFLTLLGLLLAIAIILFLGYKVLATYFKESAAGTQSGQSLSEYGIDTSTPSLLIGSTRSKIKDINKKRQSDIEQQMPGL